MIPVIIPTFHSRDLINICVRSFEKFRPENIKLRYIIIENSNDVSYKEEVLSLAENVIWVNNPTTLRGSEANAEGLEKGLELVNEEFVFLAHCDICLTNSSFLNIMMNRINNGDVAVSMLFDRKRINAMHILALLGRTKVIKSSNLKPKYSGKEQILDVGDGITQYCRDNSLCYSSLENTYNSPELEENLEERFKKLTGVPRCINNGDVLCMHLGRGISKTKGIFNKPNRVYLEEWIEFCNEILNENSNK